MKLKINEIFKSIDGEANGFYGAGQFTTFIRFQGCNLNCRYCDTVYARSTGETEIEIAEIIRVIGDVRKVTITGGEPFMQRKGLEELVNTLLDLPSFPAITIETNGSYELFCFPADKRNRIAYIVDYKLGSANLINIQEKNSPACYQALWSSDVVKFVIFTLDDYEEAKCVLDMMVIPVHVQCVLSLGLRDAYVDLESLRTFKKILHEHDERFCVQVQLHKMLKALWEIEVK